MTFTEGQATYSLLALNTANKRSFLSPRLLLDKIFLKSLELYTDTLDEYISIFWLNVGGEKIRTEHYRSFQ